MHFHLNIGLKGYHLLQDQQSASCAIHVQLQAKLQPQCCPCCQGSRLLSKGRYQRKVRHLECFKEATRLIVHTLHKGQRFCTTFCDLKNRRIFDIQPGHSEAELAGFLGKLKGRERVKIVCIDLSSPYRSIIRRYFPKASIVADRFHVVRLIQHHFMQLARHLVANLKNHRGKLAALRKAPQRLNEKQRMRLDQLFAAHPILQTLHEQMHQWRDLMNHKHQTKNQCRELISQLLDKIRQLQQNQATPLQTLSATLHDWLEPIVCMWRTTRNNGITEGFHRKMKLIQRRAYGFRSFENYRLRVIAQCG